jgi:hypothetical protein
MQCFENDMKIEPPVEDNWGQYMQDYILRLMRWTLWHQYAVCRALPHEWNRLDENFWRETRYVVEEEKEDYGEERREECVTTMRISSACKRIGIESATVFQIMALSPGRKWMPLAGNLKAR